MSLSNSDNFSVFYFFFWDQNALKILNNSLIFTWELKLISVALDSKKTLSYLDI